MGMYPKPVKNAIENSYGFKFSEYFKRAMNLVAQQWGIFMAFTLIYILITMTTGLIAIIGPVINNFVLTPCLMVGFYIAANKVQNNERLEFGAFFKGFDWIGQLAIFQLLQALLWIGLFILIGLILFMYQDNLFLIQTDPEEFIRNFPYWSLIILLPGIYFAIAWLFAPLLIVFHGLSAGDAMKVSQKIISKKWWIFFAFIIAIGFIVFLGVLLFIIGLLFSIPLGYAMLYSAFNDIVGTSSTTGGNDILDHLLDDPV